MSECGYVSVLCGYGHVWVWACVGMGMCIHTCIMCVRFEYLSMAINLRNLFIELFLSVNL